MSSSTKLTPESFEWNQEPTITPSICEEREFREIAEDFSNPLEIFREAISNAFDATASRMEINISVVRWGSKDILRIEIKDNGSGMSREELQAFFDLGNSTSRLRPNTIGEKGHGTKIYYKSSRLEVVTNQNGTQLKAEVANPYDSLATDRKPKISVASRNAVGETGTRIIVDDYNHSLRGMFKHSAVKDYLYWFTKFGSVEKEFGIHERDGFEILLKGVDQEQQESLRFGHVFPPESGKLDKLFDEFKHEAPDYFVKRWVHEGTLKNYPDIKWQAVFYLEGDSAKRAVNPLLRRGKKSGLYSVQERYGLWLCRDYIPIQRMNEWITVRGTEFTKFHAFVNCQEFRLTANRGSVMNTPPAIMEDIQAAVTDFYKNHILGGSEFSDLEWLEGQAAGFINSEKDEKDFEKRRTRFLKRKRASFKGVDIVEPSNEVGVLTLVTTLSLLAPSVFPFRILDYTTYRGLDALATVSRDEIPLQSLSLGYVEFKFTLKNRFDHLFKHLTAIVCWDITVKDGETLTDIGDNSMRLRIVPGNAKGHEHTRYWLEMDRRQNRIEVFVLSDYLREKIDLKFEHAAS